MKKSKLIKSIGLSVLLSLMPIREEQIGTGTLTENIGYSNLETLENFRGKYDEIALRSLDIVNLPLNNKTKTELTTLKTNLLQINAEELGNTDREIYGNLLKDLSDLEEDAKSFSIDRRPKPDSTLDEFLEIYDGEDAKSVFKSYKGYIGSLNTKPEEASIGDVKTLLTSNDMDEIFKIVDEQLKFMKNSEIDYVEFHEEDGNWYQNHTTSFGKNLKDRLIFVKSNHPELKKLHSIEEDLLNGNEKDYNWLLLTPNLIGVKKTSEGYKSYPVAGLSVGNGIICVSTKDFSGKGRVHPLETLIIEKHEITHATQSHRNLPTLIEEKLPRLEQIALLENLLQKLPSNKILKNRLDVIKKTVENIEYMQRPEFKDLFYSVYPVYKFESGAFLESTMPLGSLEEAIVNIDLDTNQGPYLHNALRMAIITKSSGNKNQTETVLIKEFLKAYERDDKENQINANQALAWLMPDKYKRINFDKETEIIDPPIPNLTIVHTTKDKMEKDRLMGKYVEANSIHLLDILRKYEGQEISKKDLKLELARAGKSYIYTMKSSPSENNWHKYFSTFNTENEILNIVKAHNITTNYDCVFDSNSDESYYVHMSHWKYNPIKDENGNIVQGNDTFVNATVVYGENSQIKRFKESNSSNLFSYDLNGIRIDMPNINYYSNLKNCSNYRNIFSLKVYDESQENSKLTKAN